MTTVTTGPAGALARKQQWDALLDALEALLDAPTPTGPNATRRELLGRTWDAAVERANLCELEADWR